VPGAVDGGEAGRIFGEESGKMRIDMQADPKYAASVRPDNRMDSNLFARSAYVRGGWQFSIVGLSAGRTFMNHEPNYYAEDFCNQAGAGFYTMTADEAYKGYRYFAGGPKGLLQEYLDSGELPEIAVRVFTEPSLRRLLAKRSVCKQELADLEKKFADSTHLYVMKNNRNGYYKIGIARFPLKREETLQGDDPDTTLLMFWRSYRRTERKLHEHFAPKRIRGEWFSLCQEDIDAMPALVESHNLALRPETLLPRMNEIKAFLAEPV